jgi:hypothetical protein
VSTFDRLTAPPIQPVGNVRTDAPANYQSNPIHQLPARPDTVFSTVSFWALLFKRRGDKS